MDSTAESAEVVEDFKDALQDLQSNSKPTIDVLTVIAKENTAHAEAISNVLEEHIKTTRPEWRLPALYVLDSLIRHVGPPYSTYLARNLYDTFMEVYRHVGERVRKELEAVLRTWKEPPQGSRDPRPVLPAEVTSRIENAVIKFRTIAIQHQQPSLRQMPARGGHYRESPTPIPMNMPGGFIPVTQPGLNGTPNPVNITEMMGSLQQRSGTPTFPMTAQYQPQPAVRSPIPIPALPVPQSMPIPYNNAKAEYGPPYPSVQSAITQAELQNEVREIHQKASIQNLLEPNNLDLQQLITTLESLKHMLDTQQFGTQHLQQMQAELNKISTRLQAQLSTFMANAGPAPQLEKPFTPPIMPSYPVVSSPPSIMNFAPPPTALPTSIQQPVNLDIGSLLRGLQPSQNHTANPNTYQPTSDNSFLAQLRAAGLVPATPTPERQPDQPALMTEALVGTLNQDSITKIRRPHLIRTYFERNPDQCRQCGRRFPNSDEGKKRKTRHLDWHFSINSRLADSTRTMIVHRSQYLNELQWAQLREDQDYAEETHAGGVLNAGDGSSREPDEIFVPLPSDSAKLNEPCSICMEQFKSVWHVKTQQPVWMDTIKVGDKYYHASCYHEVNEKANRDKPSANVRNGESARATPDPVLGKRKFEGAS